jgi:hypothetical protein
MENILFYGTGGIFGTYAGIDNGTINCTNCYSTGNMNSGNFEIIGGIGGIFGTAVGYIYGNVSCINCYSTGYIDNYCGGIFGDKTGQNGGNVSITGCYSTGSIAKQYCGGIVGANVGINYTYPASNILIQDCYSLYNDLIDPTSGGICGGCYSTNLVQPNVTITNCYSYCKYTSNNGIIASSTLPQIIYNPSYLYPTNGVWNGVNANQNLLITMGIWNNVSKTNKIPYFLTNGFSTPTYSKYTISQKRYIIPLNTNYIYYTVVQPTNGTLVYRVNSLIYTNNDFNAFNMYIN